MEYDAAKTLDIIRKLQAISEKKEGLALRDYDGVLLAGTATMDAILSYAECYLT